MSLKTYDPEIDSKTQAGELSKRVDALLSDFAGGFPPFALHQIPAVVSLIQAADALLDHARTFPEDAFIPPRTRLLLYLATNYRTMVYPVLDTELVAAEKALMDAKIRINHCHALQEKLGVLKTNT